MRRLTAWAAAFALVAAAAVGTFVAAPASAHDYLVDSSPKAGSTQTTPISKVRLTFDDVVLDLAKSGPGALLQVTGPNGKATHFETGCPTISGRQVSVPVSLGKAGKYLVTWQIVSADGHVVSDSIQFTYAPPAGTTASAGASSSPCKGAGAAATAAPTAGAGTAEGTVNSSAIVIVVVIAVAIVVLALIAVVVIVLTRRRGADGDGEDAQDDEWDDPDDPDDD